MTPNNQYFKTRQTAVVADAVRKRQRCKPRDAPVPVITGTRHNPIACTLTEGAFFILILWRYLWIRLRHFYRSSALS